MFQPNGRCSKTNTNLNGDGGTTLADLKHDGSATTPKAFSSRNGSPSDPPPSIERLSVDASSLPREKFGAALARFNSTPMVAGLSDLSLLSSNNHPSRPGLVERRDSAEDPSSILTLAPPKPDPADTLYPSPSGGFVPSPEEGQDWRLKPAPPPKVRPALKDPPLGLSVSGDDSSILEKGDSPSSRPGSTVPARPPSLPASQETASLIACAPSGSTSPRNSQVHASGATSPHALRPLSTASSGSRRKRSACALPDSPGFVESQSTCSSLAGSVSRRRSGASSRSHASAAGERGSRRSSRHGLAPSEVRTSLESGGTALGSKGSSGGPVSVTASQAPVKVRDFAFPNDDPRHTGKREVSQTGEQTPGEGQLREEDEADDWGLEQDEDEDEFVGDDGGNLGLPEGIYRLLYPFDAESEHELSVHAEERVRVVGALEGGWAIAERETPREGEENRGLVPESYLEAE
ncbi:hypothetical protein IE53DRAFT_60419 [Violaceomyces palustris]|uniref:Uncharacterized protein n=1 Tax=Violaceomyces palustris TaxID=1673888 RepID=A0ACD0NZG8_9BASI|nr:hypothetical protein IE53DRAFT_60419 [Violaceomyces palustris]